MEEVPASVTSWTPEGPRTVGDYENDVIPVHDAFRTINVWPNISDNLWIELSTRL